MDRKKGYNTRQRKEVLAVFSSSPTASFSAPEVMGELQKQGSAVGRTTIYRVVLRLVEEGRLFALPQTKASEPVRYQYRAQATKTISIRCSGCGSLQPLDCAFTKDFETHLQTEHGFALTEGDCLLPGLCRACQSTPVKKGTP